MKKRLRKRNKIRGGRAVFRCITDPNDGVTYWQCPDGSMRPLMQTSRVYLEVEETVKRTLSTYMDTQRDALERVFNPIPPQGISATFEIDADDPKAEPMREMFGAFKRKAIATLQECLPGDAYKNLPTWARFEEEEPTP